MGDFIFYALILLLILGVLLRLKPLYKKFKTSSNRPTKEKKIIYAKKEFIFTSRELAFFQQLIPIANSHNCFIFPKIRLADILKTSRESDEQYSDFNRIKAKHIDFCLYSKCDLSLQLLIELDDKTHERQQRIDRDIFVNKAVASANIPILHIKGFFTPEKISEAIQPYVTSKNTEPATLP